MQKLITTVWTGAALALGTFADLAFAGSVDVIRRPVSEPETLALVAIGAVAVIAARWKKRK